jgi:hypothetical protein
VRDPHHNIFYYYRGPSKAALNELQANRQIEDNTTKALVNVLEHSDPSLPRRFVRHFVPELSEDSLGGRPHFFLQKKQPDDWMPARQWLMGLSPDGSIDPKSWAKTGESGESGRVDAAIAFPESAVVVIEVKTAGELDGPQLLRHARDWKIPGAKGQLPSNWVSVVWEDVYRWARKELKENQSPATSFLLGQFAEYLEERGLSPFFGFRPDDFELRGQWRSERVIEAKGRLRALWEKALGVLDPSEADQLGEVHIGTVRANEERVWGTTNWHEGGSNLDAQVGDGELVLNLVGWDATQAMVFGRWLTSPPAGAALRQLRKHELIVWKRRAMKSASGRPFWMHETSSILDRVSAAQLAKQDHRQSRLERWQDQLEPGWEILAYHVRRTWSAEEAVQLGESLASEFAAEVRRLLPILLVINSPGRKRPVSV